MHQQIQFLKSIRIRFSPQRLWSEARIVKKQGQNFERVNLHDTKWNVAIRVVPSKRPEMFTIYTNSKNRSLASATFKPLKPICLMLKKILKIHPREWASASWSAAACSWLMERSTLLTQFWGLKWMPTAASSNVTAWSSGSGLMLEFLVLKQLGLLPRLWLCFKLWSNSLMEHPVVLSE